MHFICVVKPYQTETKSQCSTWTNNNDFHLFLENFVALVEKFQLALYRQYNSGGQSLYKPDEMNRFCEVHSPGLFDLLLRSITRVDGHATSKEHRHVQLIKVRSRQIFSISHLPFEYFSWTSIPNKDARAYSNIANFITFFYVFGTELTRSHPCVEITLSGATRRYITFIRKVGNEELIPSQ